MPIILKLLELTVPTLLAYWISKQQDKKKEVASPELIDHKAAVLGQAIKEVKDGSKATSEQKSKVKNAVKELVKPSGRGLI